MVEIFFVKLKFKIKEKAKGKIKEWYQVTPAILTLGLLIQSYKQFLTCMSPVGMTYPFGKLKYECTVHLES